MRLTPAILLGLLSLAFSRAHAADEAQSEPTKNFILPTFTPEGYRSMLVRGSEARMLTLRLIQLDDMNLTVFSGDASNRVDSVLLSPIAIISLDNDTAHGPGAVRLIRNDLDLTGEQWTYDRANKKISIARNVHVVFNTELKDMLK
jgi:hypothetical protein